MARKPEVVRKQLQNARAQERAYHSKVVQLEKELAKATGKPRKASAPRKERPDDWPAIKSAYAEASSKLKAAASRKPRGFLGLW